jgi:hypothetical protein
MLWPSDALQAQQRYANPTPKRDQKKEEKKVVVEEAPTLNGMYLAVDLFGIANNLLGGDMMSSDVSLTANIKNRYLPTVEIGMGKTDAILPCRSRLQLYGEKGTEDWIPLWRSPLWLLAGEVRCGHGDRRG